MPDHINPEKLMAFPIPAPDNDAPYSVDIVIILISVR